MNSASVRSGSTLGNQSPTRKRREALLDENREKYLVDTAGLAEYNARLKAGNEHAAPLAIKGDIVFLVEEFGYTTKYIHKCLVENANNHCTATYYLLAADHKRIL